MCNKALQMAIWKAVFPAAANFICCSWKKKSVLKYAHAFLPCFISAWKAMLCGASTEQM